MAGDDRMKVNPEPLKVVPDAERAVRAMEAVKGRSREDRLRVWLALGGTEAEFDEENPV